MSWHSQILRLCSLSRPCLCWVQARAILSHAAFNKADWNSGFLVFFWNTNELIMEQGVGRQMWESCTCCLATVQSNWNKTDKHGCEQDSTGLCCFEYAGHSIHDKYKTIDSQRNCFFQNNYLPFQHNIQNTQKRSSTPCNSGTVAFERLKLL